MSEEEIRKELERCLRAALVIVDDDDYSGRDVGEALGYGSGARGWDRATARRYLRADTEKVLDAIDVAEAARSPSSPAA